MFFICVWSDGWQYGRVLAPSSCVQSRCWMIRQDASAMNSNNRKIAHAHSTMLTIRFLFFVAILVTTSVSAQVVHYPPTSSNLNNLTFVLNGSGAPGIFNSSVTPEKVYGVYNWCNMPHVRTQEYKCVTSSSAETTAEIVLLIWFLNQSPARELYPSICGDHPTSP